MNTDFYIRLLGGLFIILGLIVKLGVWKGWYWRSRGGVYGYIPMGLVFILYSYIPQMKELGGYSYYGYIAVFLLAMGLTLYFSFRPPAWMKPTWVTWIEKHPKSVIKAMKEAALEDDSDWKEHVKDQDSVDRWAKQFRSK